MSQPAYHSFSKSGYSPVSGKKHGRPPDERDLSLFHPVHMPYLAGTFMADHAGADRRSWSADSPEKLAIGGIRNSPQYPVADAG